MIGLFILVQSNWKIWLEYWSIEQIAGRQWVMGYVKGLNMMGYDDGIWWNVIRNHVANIAIINTLQKKWLPWDVNGIQRRYTIQWVLKWRHNGMCHGDRNQVQCFGLPSCNLFQATEAMAHLVWGFANQFDIYFLCWTGLLPKGKICLVTTSLECYLCNF